MRDIFEDLFGGEPPNPMEAARRTLRAPLRTRFYREVQVGEGKGYAVLLDGRPIRTPARQPLAVPARPLAERIAAEWAAQRDAVDPASMPLTRLANAVIDRVMAAPSPVRAEIVKYLSSDLLCYRAAGPAALLARQADCWDPVLEWARQAFGARFVTVSGVTHGAQPEAAIAALAAAVPGDGVNDLWRLGALNVVTTLTGSALLALALAAGRLAVDEAWAAAHVDEDWNMEYWGRDEIALARRSYHFGEMQAAATVLALVR